MQRYFIELAYNGTRYHGWQVQPESNTVQSDLEHVLKTVCREEILVIGCGRTDTGVHASYYVAHFDSEKENLDNKDFIYKLNSFISKDIAIINITKVSIKAHARFDAIVRTYHYFINKQKNPFTQESSLYNSKKLNIEIMNKACELLLNYKDFTSFSKLHTDVKTNNCNVYQAFWQEEEQVIKFTIRANRFLRNMVRAIVGTLIDVGEGKISISDFAKIIEAKDRSQAGRSVPAHALFLADVEYPNDIFKKTI